MQSDRIQRLTIPPRPFEESEYFHPSIVFGVFFSLALTLGFVLYEIRHIAKHPSEILPLLAGASMLMGFGALARAVCQRAFRAWGTRRLDILAGASTGFLMPVALSGFSLLRDPLSSLLLLVASLACARIVGPKSRVLGRYLARVGLRELAVRVAEKFLRRFGFGPIMGAKYRLVDDWESISLWLRKARSQHRLASLWAKILMFLTVILFLSIGAAIHFAEQGFLPNWAPLLPFFVTYLSLSLSAFCYLQRVNTRLVEVAERVLLSLSASFELTDSQLVIDLFPETAEEVPRASIRTGPYLSLKLESQEGPIEVALVERVKIELGRSTSSGRSGMSVKDGRWEETFRIKLPGQTAASSNSPPVREYKDFRSNGVQRWRVGPDWLDKELERVLR